MSGNIIIFNVTFADAFIDVTYAEERDVSTDVMSGRNIRIPIAYIDEEVRDVLESLEEAVDKGLIEQSNQMVKKR